MNGPIEHYIIELITKNNKIRENGWLYKQLRLYSQPFSQVVMAAANCLMFVNKVDRIEKLIQSAFIVRPDDESVILVSEPCFMLELAMFLYFLLNVCNYRRLQAICWSPRNADAVYLNVSFIMFIFMFHWQCYICKSN